MSNFFENAFIGVLWIILCKAVLVRFVPVLPILQSFCPSINSGWQKGFPRMSGLGNIDFCSYSGQKHKTFNLNPIVPRGFIRSNEKPTAQRGLEMKSSKGVPLGRDCGFPRNTDSHFQKKESINPN